MTDFIEDIQQFQNIYKQIMDVHKDATPYLQACCVVLGADVLLENMYFDDTDKDVTKETLEQIEPLKKLSNLRQRLLGIYEEYFID